MARVDGKVAMSDAVATLVDVAAAARVSVATASRAINDRTHVSPHTRARVLEAAKRLHFQPSHAARTLRTRRTDVVGLIVPDISSIFYASALRAAEHTLRRRGYTLFIADSEEQAHLEAEAVEALLAHRVSGLILAPTSASATMLRRALARYPVPIVTIDNRIDALDADAVLLDNVAGMCALTSHLIDHGHRRIAYLGGLLRESSGVERLKGYRAGLEGAGLPFDPRLALEGDWSLESGRRMMEAVLDLPTACGAVVVGCHAMALGALLALRAAGQRVPADVALVSFDDVPYGSMMDPPLTALQSQDYDVGRLAAEMLLAHLDNPDARGGCEVRLPARLVVRRSCGCP